MSRTSQRKNAISKKRESLSTEIKPLTSQEREQLRAALLRSSEMKSMQELETASLRLLLLKKKIQLCLVECDWHKKDDATESMLIANKRKLLLEILEFYGQRKFKSLDLLKHSFRLLWCNLFRALPDHQAMKTAPGDDEMDFREPAWEHLVIVYEIAFHVVTNTEIDKKVMQKHLRGRFLQNLINLFASLDDREPQYVKIILHAIYGRFMALRKDIRQYLCEFCYRYIYDSKCELNDSNSSIVWQGIPEILAIFCSIVQGLNVPVKSDYHVLLRNVLVPLHKTYHLDAFHEELVQCCTQFIVKDAHSACIVLGGMLKFWPVTSALKEQLFMDEIVLLLNACSDYIEQFGCNKAAAAATAQRVVAEEEEEDESEAYVLSAKELQFEAIIVAVIHRLCKCMFSPHHQVSERALLIWKEDSLKLCLDVFGDQCWSTVHTTLQNMTEKYWLPDIRQVAKNVLADLQRTNPEFFKTKTTVVRVSKLQRLERRQKNRSQIQTKGTRMPMEQSQTVGDPSSQLN